MMMDRSGLEILVGTVAIAIRMAEVRGSAIQTKRALPQIEGGFPSGQMAATGDPR